MLYSVQVFFSRIKWHGRLSFARTFIVLLFFQFVGISSTCFAQAHPFVNAVPEEILSGFTLAEGPLWLADSSLIFSDVPNDIIYQWKPGQTTASTYLSPSGESNGLTLDLAGNVLMAQHKKRRIARLNKDGSETEIISRYDDKKFNSPNDMAVKSNGSIYFTDPDYGDNQLELGYHGIFVVNTDGQIWLLDKTLNQPNGIAFSPDETKLYVTSFEADIWVWDVDSDTTITNKQFFIQMPGGYADGIKVDQNGLIYAATFGLGGIWIIDPDGSKIDLIPVPESVTNLNWGDPERSILYITGEHAVYRLSVITDIKNNINKPENFSLYQNYPNPFNPETSIHFTVPKMSRVSLAIYDILGRKIRALVSETKAAGSYNVTWNGKNNQGQPLASGLYFYKLQAGEFSATKKMMLLK